VRERLTILVIVGTSMDEHSLRSQVGMGSESDCLFRQLDRISWTSDSEAGVKTEKSGGVAGGVGECGDDVVGLLGPASNHSVFYRPDALPAAQPTASKH